MPGAGARRVNRGGLVLHHFCSKSNRFGDVAQSQIAQIAQVESFFYGGEKDSANNWVQYSRLTPN